MKTIYKYQLGGRTVLRLPIRAQVLTVQRQGPNLCMWVMLDKDLPTEERTFVVYGTGFEVRCNPVKYVGTVPMEDGFMWHVFEQLTQVTASEPAIAQ